MDELPAVRPASAVWDGSDPTRVGGGADAVRAAAGLGDASVVAAPPPSREVLGDGLSGCHRCTAAHGRWRVESGQCAVSDGVIAMYGESREREGVSRLSGLYSLADCNTTCTRMHCAHPHRALPRTRACKTKVSGEAPSPRSRRLPRDSPEPARPSRFVPDFDVSGKTAEPKMAFNFAHLLSRRLARLRRLWARAPVVWGGRPG